jgi:branched-chain amino acid transport system permease protein
VFFGVNISTAAGDYWLVFAFAAVALILVKLIELSPLRREAIAVRDQERISKGLGMNTLRIRIVMFTLGCVFAAAGGGLFAQTQGFIAPSSFEVSLGIDIFLIVILGGVGSMWGCVIGSIFVVVLPELVTSAATYSAIVFSGCLLLAIFVLPRGFISLPDIARTLWRRLTARRATAEDLSAAASEVAP